MPVHHVPDDMLIAYAAGWLGSAESLLVACHLTLCPSCRAAVDHAEAVGAALLGSPGPAAADDMALDAGERLLDRILARLDDAGPSQPVPGHGAGDPAGVVPAPLRRLVGALEVAPWRQALPGLDLVPVPGTGEGKLVHLARLAPGACLPRHDHAGTEAILVLAGGYADDQGRFARGDVSLRASGEPHEQRADPGDPCIWLVVADDVPILLPDEGA